MLMIDILICVYYFLKLTIPMLSSECVSIASEFHNTSLLIKLKLKCISQSITETK